MTNSFFPKTDAGLVIWATNYKEELGTNATPLDLTPAQVASEVAMCEAIITSVNTVNTQKNSLKGLVDAKNVAVEMQGGSLRLEIGRHKKAVGYTETIGQDLGIVSTYVEFNPTTYKAKIFAELFGGFIRIRFRKMGANGINLYQRKKGSIEWLFLARATKSPFDYHLSLLQADQPEHWEFRAFGVINDAEIGIASDIVEIVYGG